MPCAVCIDLRRRGWHGENNSLGVSAYGRARADWRMSSAVHVVSLSIARCRASSWRLPVREHGLRVSMAKRRERQRETQLSSTQRNVM